MNQENDWIQRLAQGEEEVLGLIYQKFRIDFIAWLIKARACDPDLAKEIYQISILVLYDNVRTGKLVELKSSLKTYLFAIGKNKLRAYNRKQSKIVDDYLFEHIPLNDSTIKHEQEHMMVRMEKAFTLLGDQCRKVLELFYFNKCSMQTICERLNLSSVDATKMKKSRCLKKLRDLV